MRPAWAVDRVAFGPVANTGARALRRRSSEHGAGVVMEASTLDLIVGRRRKRVKLVRREGARACSGPNDRHSLQGRTVTSCFRNSMTRRRG